MLSVKCCPTDTGVLRGAIKFKNSGQVVKFEISAYSDAAIGEGYDAGGWT